MSKHGLAQAFETWEAEEIKREMARTFGHLAPKKNKTYKARIVFTLTCYGSYEVIESNLPNSPWMFQAEQDFVSDHAKERGTVYKFEGTFCNYVFKGITTEVSIP